MDKEGKLLSPRLFNLWHNIIKNKLISRLNEIKNAHNYREPEMIIYKTWGECEKIWKCVYQKLMNIIKEMKSVINIDNIIENNELKKVLKKSSYEWIWRILIDIKRFKIKEKIYKIEEMINEANGEFKKYSIKINENDNMDNIIDYSRMFAEKCISIQECLIDIDKEMQIR